MTVDWQIKLKKKKDVEEGECPFYHTNTQNTELRVFFGYMKKTYDWNVKEDDLKGFDGCLAGVMAEVYDQRLKEYVRFIYYLLVEFLYIYL